MTNPVVPADAEASRLEAAVAASLAPSADLLGRLARARTRLVEVVVAAAARRGSPLVRAVVAGSAARETFLSDRLDIDLFLLFPADLPDDRLREEGLALGREVLTEPTTRYAEHPYLRGKFDGFTVDAVPGFAITDPSRPRSPVDRTPFHQEYLAARETPDLVREVRLAKQFLRTLGVYGSEAKTEGFSGYLVELLVLKFGSFRGLLRTAAGWTVPARLMPAGREPPGLPEQVALVLTDPVDPHRNVASALSRQNLGIVIISARAYLERPDRAWFEPRPAGELSGAEALRRVQRRASHVTVIRIPRPPELVDDTLYPQLRKAERAVAEELDRAGFLVLGSSSAADAQGLVVAVELGARLRPAVRTRPGPPAGLDRAGDFLDTWPAERPDVLQGPYVRPDGRLGVETFEEDREPESYLRRNLARLSLGKNLSAAGEPTVAALEDAGAGSGLAEALRALVAKELPWPESARRRTTPR
jgi:tRNA nucleotidyltransferase (CCA-adding enzyme)